MKDELSIKVFSLNFASDKERDVFIKRLMQPSMSSNDEENMKLDLARIKSEDRMILKSLIRIDANGKETIESVN